VFTPYDWQEGIGHRAQYIEGKLAQGAAVLAVSLNEGILVFTYRRQARKIYEVYDRLIFAGLGQQSDVDSLRLAALEFASKEGFNRSEEDVTIQRVAVAMSTAVKQAFNDFRAAPLIARTLYAEVNGTPAEDLYYALDYDGDYALSRRVAFLAGNEEKGSALAAALTEVDPTWSVAETLDKLKAIWASTLDEGQEMPANLSPEAVLMERSSERENRFRQLYTEDF
jgi:proteasome alpha subunit